jgi:hypothetical protein
LIVFAVFRDAYCAAASMATITNEKLCEFILQHYAQQGLDVQSLGDDSIVVNLPPAFRDLTDFCCTLFEEFGCLVELEYDNDAVRAIVWNNSKINGATSAPAPTPATNTHTVEQAPVRSGGHGCFWTTSIFVALLACAFYYLYVMRAQSFRQDMASFLLWLINYI